MWDGSGLPRVITEVVDKSPRELRAELYGNIVVCGGSAALPNLAQRLQAEVAALAPPGTRRVFLSHHRTRGRTAHAREIAADWRVI
jgi:actin-related protein